MNSNYKKSKFNFQLHNGISSILLILIILSLVSFSILSISSANADYRLTQKILSRTSNYYEACNEAENKIASIDQTLQTLYASSSSKAEYYSQAGIGTSFFISISNNQQLNIDLSYNYPEQDGDTFYTITRWQIETNTDNMEYNETLPLPK